MSERLGASRTPTDAELLQAAIEQRLADLHVAMPGVVTKYDVALQVADVKPLLSRAVIFDDGDEIQEVYPIIPNVPVVFRRGGGYFESMPLAIGDNVLLIFNERSIDNFFYSSGKTETDPVDLRKHDLTDAIAIPGFYPSGRVLKEELASAAVWGKEHGAQVRAKGTTIEVVTAGASAATDFVAMATKVLTELAALVAAYNPHTHAYTSPGGAAVTGSPVPLMKTPGSTASTNLKAD